MANINDTVQAHSSIANNGFMTVQPASGEHWAVINIYAPVGTAIELYRTDGANDIKIDSDNSGGWRNYKYLLTNGQYLKVKNVSGSTAYLGFDGIRRA